MIRLLLLLVLAGASGIARAVDGALDTDFGTEAEYPGYGFYSTPFGQGLYDSVVAIATAPDGRVYLFGDVPDGQGGRRATIHRADPDGYFDFSYGTQGLRTLVPPCPAGALADAVVDGQGRPWLAFGGCDDFEVYRLTADGLPDTTLLGSGRLSVAFNLGGNNGDRLRRIALTPQGGIVMAGLVASATGTRLGLAHYTGQGAPAPGFGNAGRVDFDFDWGVSRVAVVHRMPDGRIVAAGETRLNGAQSTQFAVRVQPSGAPDLAFGNSAPGVSEVDYRVLMNTSAAAPTINHALVEPDGSIVQVGSWWNIQDPGRRWDMFLMRWRPTGELDTGPGPAGYRLYGRNFGGNPDAGNYNVDGFSAIARQGDGKYVLAGYSHDALDRARVTLTRLRRDFQPDGGFGQGGMVDALVPIAINGQHGMRARALALRPGGILTGLEVATGPGAVLSIMANRNDVLFADTFD